MSEFVEAAKRLNVASASQIQTMMVNADPTKVEATLGEILYLLGPLTPSQISLSRSSNDALTIWITNSKSLVDQPFSVWPTGLQKFNLFLILNFPSLFFDWSIQNF